MPPKSSISTATDAILPMTDDYMQEIVRREKNYEFRRYRISANVARIWFYLNAPLSSIAYICEIDPARTRGAGQEPLPEDGNGNKEFNTRHKDWEGYDFAYRIRSVRKLREPLTIADLKANHGFKIAPRGLVYVNPQLAAAVPWQAQELLWSDNSNPSTTSGPGGTRSKKRSRESTDTTGPAPKAMRLEPVAPTSPSA